MLSAVIVQGNYPGKSKFTSEPGEILEKYLNLSYSAKPNNADLIIFPETAIHSSVYKTTGYQDKLYRLCSDFNAQLLFGSQYNYDDKHYNACISVMSGNEINAVYLKRHLVPYGEYDPFGLNFAASDFSAGKKEAEIIKTDNEKIGCVICFESVFPESIRKAVKKGAQAVTVLTNDSWLGDKIPLYQHHSHSIMRAVENNRYVLTSANTGISSVIDNKGKIIAESELNKEYVINENYFLNNDITLYTKYGDIIILPSCIIILYSCAAFVIIKVIN